MLVLAGGMIFVGLVIGFVASAFMGYNICSNHRSFDNMIKDHVFGMIATAFGGLLTLVGLLIGAVHVIQELLAK